MNFIITLLILIFILGIIILIHEFGHFIVAKKIGIYIDEFSIGMGPTIYSKVGKDKIKYSLRALPIGGYVSMAEKQLDNKLKKEQVLENKSFMQKFSVLIMGIVMNIILAIALFFISGLLFGRPIDNTIVGVVKEGTPAYLSGIEVGDTINEINGESVSSWEDVLLEISAKKLSENYVFDVTKKDGTHSSYIINPEVSIDSDGNETRLFGLGKQATTYKKGLGSALIYSIEGTVKTIKTILNILSSLFNGSVSVSNLSGPVGIYSVVDSIKQSGLEPILYLIAYLSINVAVINLIPIPVFDGGRILLIIIEAITHKKTNEKLELIINYIGFAIMVILMLFVTINDILKLL